jgi:hypothetical protein
MKIASKRYYRDSKWKENRGGNLSKKEEDLMHRK